MKNNRNDWITHSKYDKQIHKANNGNIKEKFLQTFFVYNKNVSSPFIIVYKALLSKVNVAY